MASTSIEKKTPHILFHNWTAHLHINTCMLGLNLIFRCLRWIGRAGPNNYVLLKWFARSPDISPCDFFLWGCSKDKVFVPLYSSTRTIQLTVFFFERLIQKKCGNVKSLINERSMRYSTQEPMKKAHSRKGVRVSVALKCSQGQYFGGDGFIWD